MNDAYICRIGSTHERMASCLRVLQPGTRYRGGRQHPHEHDPLRSCQARGVPVSTCAIQGPILLICGAWHYAWWHRWSATLSVRI